MENLPKKSLGRKALEGYDGIFNLLSLRDGGWRPFRKNGHSPAGTDTRARGGYSSFLLRDKVRNRDIICFVTKNWLLLLI